MYSSTYQYTVQLRSFVSESAKEKKRELGKNEPISSHVTLV